MRQYSIKILLIIVLTVFFHTKSKAQGCCTAGTSSLGGVERSIIGKNKLSIMAGYDKSNLETTYSGRNKIGDPLKRTATVSYFSLQMEYGLSEKVSVLGIINYTIKERSVTYTSLSNNELEPVTFKGEGLSDLILIGKYELIKPTFFSPLSFAVGGGIKLPTGDFRKENNGTRLAIDLQPGTGAIDALLWTYFSYNFLGTGLSISGNFLYSYPGTNLEGYKIGDELLFVLGSDYYFTDYLSFTLQSRSRFADADYANGRFLPSTGGTSHDLYPYLNYFEGNSSLRIYTQIPLYRNLRGIQLTVSQVLGVQVQHYFGADN